MEFYTYFIFALICVYCFRYFNWVAVALAFLGVATLTLFNNRSLGNGGDLGMFRCIYGFIVGHYVWRLSKAISLNSNYATTVELCVVAAVIVFVSLANSWITLLAPFVFGAAVWVFSAERGAVSSALRLPPFLKLGALSYSIYMTHAVILHVAMTCANVTDEFLHMHIVTDYYVPMLGTTTGSFKFGSRWLGDVVEIPYIAIVIAVSISTFRYIELPARNFFYRRAKPRVD